MFHQDVLFSDFSLIVVVALTGIIRLVVLLLYLRLIRMTEANGSPSKKEGSKRRKTDNI